MRFAKADHPDEIRTNAMRDLFSRSAERDLFRRSAEREVQHRDRYYVGITDEVQRRLSVHNSGGSQYTGALRPWELVAAIEFTNPARAIAFEQYLKTGSGRAFAKRHFN